MEQGHAKVLFDALNASLSPDQVTRVQAEQRLEELMTIGESGLALANLLVSQNHELPLRQAAGTALQRKFVLDHWSPYFPSFKGNAPTVEIKQQIRDLMFGGLADPLRRIRSSAGYVLSTIAHSDWPDECPDLLTSLITLLSSGSSDAVDGAMRVFAELTQTELSEEQLLPVLRELLPVLMHVLGQPEKYSVMTRARVISIFSQCVDVLFMVKDEHPAAVKEATESLLPQWLNATKVLLDLDPQPDAQATDNWDGLKLRLEIFQALSKITYSFPRAIAPVLPQFYATALYHLQKLSISYLDYYANPDGPSPLGTSEDSSDFDIFPSLGRSIMDFAKVGSKTKTAKAWFAGEGGQALAPLILATVSWTQMTTNDEDEWSSDANAFIADENEEEAWSLRTSCFDMMEALMDSHRVLGAQAINLAIQQAIQDSHGAKSAGHEKWWKPLEAALAVAGSQADALIECLEDEEDAERPIPFDARPLLADVIPPLLSMSDVPFLQGRAFVFASQFSALLPANLFSQYLDAALQALETSGLSMPVKVSAVKAVLNFSSESRAKEVVIPQANRIGQDLVPFLPEATEDSLALVVEALLSVIVMDGSRWLTTELATSIVDALLKVWMKYYQDPILLSLLTDIFTAIAECPTPGVYQTVVSIVLPVLGDALNQQPSTPANTQAWITGSALDIANSLMKGAPASGLGEGFLSIFGPPLFGCLVGTDDRETLQNGIESLTLIIRKACPQLLAFISPSGEPGLSLVLKVVAKVLTTSTTSNTGKEVGGLAVGDMIIHLLRQAGDTAELRAVLPELLTALVTRLQTAETPTFIQSLIMPFAYLIHRSRDDVLVLLEGVHLETSTGLDILVNVWLENSETIQGFWASRMSTVALSDLFTSNRPSLVDLRVRGDMIIRPETQNVIMTRSRTKQMPTEYTSIPFHVKVLKLLLRDLQNTAEGASLPSDVKDVDTVDDDDAEDWEEEEDLFQGLKDEQLGFLSNLIDDAAKEDGAGAEEDEALKDDPISQIDVRTYIVDFLRQCAKSDPTGFSRLVDDLSTDEIVLIQRIVN